MGSESTICCLCCSWDDANRRCRLSRIRSLLDVPRAKRPMSQLDRLHVAGDGAEQTLQDLQLGDARIQFHLRGEGEAGTAPGTVRLE